MLNTVVKPPYQLLKNCIIAAAQSSHQQLPCSRFQANQAIEQHTYLRNINFLWSPAGDNWQTQPKLQLSVYRQFIRVLLGNRHMILAESVQTNTFSLRGNAHPINLDFWIHIRSGVIQ